MESLQKQSVIPSRPRAKKEPPKRPLTP